MSEQTKILILVFSTRTGEVKHYETLEECLDDYPEEIATQVQKWAEFARIGDVADVSEHGLLFFQPTIMGWRDAMVLKDELTERGAARRELMSNMNEWLDFNYNEDGTAKSNLTRRYVELLQRHRSKRGFGAEVRESQVKDEEITVEQLPVVEKVLRIPSGSSLFRENLKDAKTLPNSD